ncbi:MAG: nucleotide exchange factor GrpE [Bacteroidia bacterium]|nr:nucleotide exchange factor GrpE [Bacteroidia bacterium]MCC7532834.1 nucleotide exchange factor GrpE [Bacteroidia bacterium]MCZ2141002.1 nucleotide exchange factor GrpE [Bacteroidia bacterium]
MNQEKNKDENTIQNQETVNNTDTIANDAEKLTEETAETTETPARDFEAELKEKDDKYIRLYAEFENYKRRTMQERIELFKTAGQEIMLAMIPVLDDFERALKAMETATDVNSIKEGIDLVSQKFKNTLMQNGLKPMDCIGKPFNADLHEAITNIPAPTEDLKDKIVDEVEKGYLLGEKVIRYAKVVVGS